MKVLKNVLFVEDDISTIFLNKRVIAKVGCAERVEVTANGVDAIEFLRKKIENDELLPELILLDINMPKMNGWEFIEVYKELIGETENAPIIIMVTTSMNEADRNKANEMPLPTGFLNKPLDIEKVKMIMDQHFN